MPVPTRTVADPFPVPRSARLVAWGNAMLRGLASPDEAVDRVVAADTAHRVSGLAGDPDPVGWALALGRLRSSGATGLRLVLPVPGDPLGLAGPAAFPSAAAAAGEAVLVLGPSPWGLVPTVSALGSSGTGVRWDGYGVQPPRDGDLPTLAEADRELAQAVREATAVLTELDVARTDPAAFAALATLRSGTGNVGILAPGYPPRAHRVFASARLVGAIVVLARQSAGAAVSAAEMASRAAVLQPLERASRRALSAACNAALEPNPT